MQSDRGGFSGCRAQALGQVGFSGCSSQALECSSVVVAHRLSCCLCKTQNSGLRSKEEKPRDPINQPSRCNKKEGLLSVAQTGDSDLLGGRAHRTANWVSFLYAKKKKHTISILHTGYKVIGYTFAKQSYWYKLHELHVYKAILLAQTSRAFVQT